MPKKRSAPIREHWHNITGSTIILGCGIRDGKLTISFHKRGVPSGIYQYDTEDLGLCCEMADAGSPGMFFHNQIKWIHAIRIG